VLRQFPQSLRAWPDFGVRWDSVAPRQSGTIHGAAGLNVAAYDGIGQILVQAESAPVPVRLDVRSGGTALHTIALDRREQRLSWSWPSRGLAFIEIRAGHVQTGAPADVRIVVNPR
jgi:hypothetical protein